MITLKDIAQRRVMGLTGFDAAFVARVAECWEAKDPSHSVEDALSKASAGYFVGIKDEIEYNDQQKMDAFEVDLGMYLVPKTTNSM